MQENVLQKRDIKMIAKMSQQMDYGNLQEVKKLHDIVIQKNVFQTEFGKNFIQRLELIYSGGENPETCVLCGQQTEENPVICQNCLNNVSDGVTKQPIMQEKPNVENDDTKNVNVKVHSKDRNTKNVDTEEMKKQTQETIQNLKRSAEKAVDNFTEKINTMAGGSGKVDLRFKDLFSAIFKKHEKNEAEAIFICGTSTTTPEAKDISTEWPKPWLYSRIALLLFASFYILLLCYTGFQNLNVIPDIIFIGSCMVPVAILMFFFEVNAPRNISIFNVCKIFLLGGVASIFITLLLFKVFSYDSLDFVGAIVVGVVEELGKFFIVAYFIKKNKYLNYILNGMLVGAAVGAGFAVLESAGYAMRFYITYLLGGGYGKAFDRMVEIIYNRGILSPGGHIAWAAITGAAIVIVMEHGIFDTSRLKSKKFLGLFALPVIMHAVWDMPINLIQIGPFELQHIALVAIAWIIILVLLHRGLEEINHE